MKYKIISADTIKNLIEFLDEVQFDAAKESTIEDMHKINFCSWAIQELLNSYNVINASDLKSGKGKSKPKKKYTRKPKYKKNWDDEIQEGK